MIKSVFFPAQKYQNSNSGVVTARVHFVLDKRRGEITM